MESYFDRVPVELFVIISEYLNYEDVVSLEKLTDFSILNKVLHINSETRYTLTTAPQIHLGILDTRIHYVSDSILISVNDPTDFYHLFKFTNLKNANFVLPHNKYESMTKFKNYCEVFFEFFFGRNYPGNYKDLVFRILFSSDYNKELGLVIHKGFVNLANAYNYVGYDIGADQEDQYDFLIDIINAKRKKYQRDLLLMYALGPHEGTPGKDEKSEFPMIWETGTQNEYVKKGIFPVFPFKFSKDAIVNIKNEFHQGDIENIKDDLGDTGNFVDLIHTFDERDYLIVSFYYHDDDNIYHKMGDNEWLNRNPQFKGKTFDSTSSKIARMLEKDPTNKIITDLHEVLDAYQVIYEHDSFMKLKIQPVENDPDRDYYRFLQLDNYSSNTNNFEYMYSKVLDNTEKDDQVPILHDEDGTEDEDEDEDSDSSVEDVTVGQFPEFYVDNNDESDNNPSDSDDDSVD